MASSKRFQPVVMPDQPAGFPRVPGGASARVVLPSAFDPLPAAYEPPVGAAAPATPPLPPAGITSAAEARTVQVTWPTNFGAAAFTNEVTVYSFQKRWRAVDVYVQDLNLLTPGFVITVRIYALGAQSPPTLVASGRIGHLQGVPAGGMAVVRPVWIAAARSQADRFLVTLSVGLSSGALPPATEQFSTITCIGTNEADPAPPLLGAIPMANDVDAGAVNGISSVGVPAAELLMVQGVVGPAVATPRYLHVHDRVAPAGVAPMFCFPLGAGVAVAGGGGFGGTFWFPPGLRHQASDVGGGLPLWFVAVSSTMLTTTIAGDCGMQALIR